MSDHPLDHPAAVALATRQASLGRGDGRARRYDPGYAMFAAWEDDEALAALVSPGEVIATVGADSPSPPGFEIDRAACVQMTAALVAPRDTGAVQPLGEADVPAMRALAAYTDPGPFFASTHRMGRFVGIRVGGQLVAMAGERMWLPGFREVSAVCTLPVYRRKGYGAAVTAFVTRRMLAEGDTPFLQAYAVNCAAISAYTRLGFSVRREVIFTRLRRTGDPA